jgi:hypothetical protein
METITVPKQALDVLFNALGRYPFAEVAPVVQKFNELMAEAKKDKTNEP